MQAQNTTADFREQGVKPVLSVNEVIELLAGTLSRASIYKALRRGEIPHRRVGKRILVRRDTLLAWLAGEPKEAA